jgi:hypothetical protein
MKSKTLIVFLHGFLCFPILMVGSSFASMPGGLARSLSLTGSGVIPFIPFAAVAIYVLIVSITRKNSKRWIRIGGIAAAYLLAIACINYPNWLFDRFSQKIEIGAFIKHGEFFLPADEIMSFEQTFKTPAVQYASVGRWLVVPRNKFSESMVSFLRDQAQEKSAPVVPSNRSQPIRLETNQERSNGVNP